MFNTGNDWGWLIKSDQSAKADFEAEVETRDFSGYSANMAGDPIGEMQKREIVSRDCGHAVAHGGSYRCIACGTKLVFRSHMTKWVPMP